jgi:hypothetical protein
MGFLIKIDKQLVNNKYWDETDIVIVYALDYCTIGISPVRIPDWERTALYETITEILKTTDMSFIIELDDDIVDFYRIKERKHVISGYKDFVLVTVTNGNKE